MPNQRKLGLIALESAKTAGEQINRILAEWRKEDNFLIPAECPRFGSGEGKGLIKESVRDRDIYILVDVCNHSVSYRMYGEKNRMSPDDLFCQKSLHRQYEENQNIRSGFR